ncbi:MAG: type II secretion system F family protein [Candidatus Sungiibacteriota bacterium]
MITFVYSAAQKTGAIVKGEKDAENEKTLAVLLKQEGLLLLQVEDRGPKSRFGIIHLDIGELIARVRPISIVDKMLFTRNLSVMVNAGLSLTRALDALAQETTNPKFRKAIEDIHTSVTAGKSFSESLRAHTAVFGALFSNMVEMGETTGKLSLVLKLLANQMQKDNTLRKRVKGAMMYPAVILIALFGIGAMMMIYVVPTLTKTLEELGAELPITTRAIIAISNFMVAYALALPLIAAGVVIGFWRLLKTKYGKEFFDLFVLKLPVLGPLIQKFNAARFCRTLSYMVMSGVPIVRSLDITASVLGNTLFRHAIEEAARGIQTGKQLHEILAVHPKIFRHIVIQMIEVGEETGKLSEMLLRLAVFFEEDVANTTKNMSTIIEPILMVVIGIIVGLFAVSMLQPIYTSLGNV